MSVTLVSPAETDAPIEMPFGLRTRVGPGNHVVDGGPDPSMARGNFEGEEGRPIIKYWDTLRSYVQKRLNRSRCRLGCGLLGCMCRRNHMFDGGPATPRDVAIATNFRTQFSITVFVGYNFGCMIASDTLFDCGGRFSGSSYPMKT